MMDAFEQFGAAPTPSPTPAGNVYDQFDTPAQSANVYDQFDQPQHRISAQDAALLTHGPSGPVAAPAPQPIDKLAADIKGNATEDIPSVSSAAFDKATGRGFGSALRTGVVSALGNDAQYAQALLKNVPGSTLSQDANGNPVIQLKTGQRFYVNQPGLDMSDVERGIDKAAAFIPAAELAATGKTAPMRMLIGGLTSGATDAAMQGGAGLAADSVDHLSPQEVGMSALFGVGSEAVPAVAALAGRGAKAVVTTESGLKNLGRQIAAQNDMAGNLPDSTLIALGKRAPQIKAGMSPDAALAESEFGFRLTQGQKTGDAGQLRREEMLRNASQDSPAAQVAKNAYDAQQANLGTQAQKIQDYLGGGSAPANPSEATQRVMTGMQQQAGDLKGEINDAYDVARSKNAAIPVSHLNDLANKVSGALQNLPVDPVLTPRTSRALDILTQDMAKVAQPGVTGINMKAVEMGRQKIMSAMDGATGSDLKALKGVKDAYDSWVTDAFDRALVSGDPDALAAVKQARALRAQYGARFQPLNRNDQGGKIVQQLLDQNADPDKMAQAIFGAGQIAPAAAASIVTKLRAALGSDKDAWDAVRAAVVQKAITRRNGEIAGPQAIVSNLQTLLRDRPALVRNLYKPEELDKLNRFAMAMKALMPPPGIARSSGTAERALDYFTEMLQGIPGGSAMTKLLRAPANARTASRMMAPVRAPISPLVTAGTNATLQSANRAGLFPAPYADSNANNK